ncbi:MAG: alpha/beta fold hydrolase [Desulfobacterales bacterium]
MKDNSVILIHGMWSTSNTLSTLRQRLETRGYRVYSPNLPWHEDAIRDSDNKVADLSIVDYATHLMDYITNLKLEEPPILIGHSMGGLLAQKLSTRIKARALVLLCPAQPWGINIITPSATWTTFNAYAKWRFWGKSHRPSLSRAKYGLFNMIDEETQIELYNRLIPESGRAYFEIVFWFFDKRKATHVKTKEIIAPILAITGEKDRIIRPSVVKRVAENYPQADYRCYHAHAHWLFDEPGSEEIVNDIDAWLKGKLK